MMSASKSRKPREPRTEPRMIDSNRPLSVEGESLEREEL